MGKKKSINQNDLVFLARAQHVGDKSTDMVVKDLIGEFTSRPKKSKGSVNKRYHGNRSWIKSQQADARKRQLDTQREEERRALLDPVAMALDLGRDPSNIQPSTRHFA